jgi:hypothetical protein
MFEGTTININMTEDSGLVETTSPELIRLIGMLSEVNIVVDRDDYIIARLPKSTILELF